MLTRAISGALYVGLIIACVILWDWCFIGLLMFLAVLGIIEFHHLLDSKSISSMQQWMVIVMDCIAAFILILFAQFPLVLPVFLAYVVLRPVAQIFSPEHDAIRSVMVSYASLVYIAVPLMCLECFASKWVVLLLFILIWVNDTGAYLVGSFIGRHKLCPSISPKKTWEGFFGGVALTFGIAFVLTTFYPVTSYAVLMPMAGAVVVFGTFGDLFESKLKRSIGVKDSGNLIPGHGGILDRIDSLLLVSPSALLVFYLMQLF